MTTRINRLMSFLGVDEMWKRIDSEAMDGRIVIVTACSAEVAVSMVRRDARYAKGWRWVRLDLQTKSGFTLALPFKPKYYQAVQFDSVPRE